MPSWRMMSSAACARSRSSRSRRRCAPSDVSFLERLGRGARQLAFLQRRRSQLELFFEGLGVERASLHQARFDLVHAPKCFGPVEALLSEVLDELVIGLEGRQNLGIFVRV